MKVWLGLWPGRQRRHSVDAVFPLGGIVEVPPLSDRSLLVKTLPEFAQAGGGGALGVVPSLEVSPLENLFRCSLQPWLVAVGGGVPLLGGVAAREPTNSVYDIDGWLAARGCLVVVAWLLAANHDGN